MLTIEELKSLKIGDWVWIVDCGIGCYVNIIDNTNDFIFQVAPESDYLRYEDYGTQWIAYKNKEEAETREEDNYEYKYLALKAAILKYV